MILLFEIRHIVVNFPETLRFSKSVRLSRGRCKIGIAEKILEEIANKVAGLVICEHISAEDVANFWKAILFNFNKAFNHAKRCI